MTEPSADSPRPGTALLRSHRGHEKVSFLELFFDLVFVFAITQLSHLLIHHFTPLGALETVMLTLAVWWVWIFTAWVTNWLDPEKTPVRLALLVLMVLGLVLSASLPEAFESRGLAFAGAFVAMQVGRCLFFLWAVRGHRAAVRNFQRITVWLSASAIFWIAGGLAHGEARIALWLVALVIEYISPSQGFYVPGLGRTDTKEWDVEGAHLAERCGLFIIIALGESVLVTGATFSELEWSLPTIAAFLLSIVGSISMWWLYFGVAAETGTAKISHSSDPGRVARLAYTYIHLFLVGGIIVLAVSDEFVLHHPLGHTDLPTALSILCGTALFLAGSALFYWTITGRVARGYLIGLLALAASIPAIPYLPPIALSAWSTLIFLGVAAGFGCRDNPEPTLA